ncbi:hypothetical protein [Micromonospora sp. DT31]|uniref:hypothetical protein n=1 Tax=Micromonospora sp. DT31 TaxID=3393434 RepID=UPI003CFB0225
MSFTEDLTVMPSDPKAVCHLIRRFLANWQVLEVGEAPLPGAEEEVLLAERRLGFALPVALRWVFTHLGAENQVIGAQDPLVPPSLLRVDEDNVLVYRTENQNCASWGIRREDIGKADPPVVWKNLQADAEEGWLRYHDRVSVDLLEMSMSEAMLTAGEQVIQMEIESGLPVLPRGLVPLAIPEHVFWPVPDGAPVRWYGIAECVIRNDGDTWLWGFGRASADLDVARSALPGPWESLAE